MHKQFLKYIAVLWFIIIKCIPGHCQIPSFTSVPNLDPEDSLNITKLIMNGTKVRTGIAIGWFPKDSLSSEKMNNIMDSLNRGIVAAEKFIKAPYSWQVQEKGKPYTFYFRLDSFVSHASGAGFISIPFWRIKQGKAPWLHEALHEMLNSKASVTLSLSIPEEVLNQNMPLWLIEGLPDYISLKVGQKNNLQIFDVFTGGYVQNVDSVCKTDLAGNRSAYILDFIGTKGMMPELFGKQRRLYAPTFYHCSCSFIKFLVEQYGIDPLIASIAAYSIEMKELEKRLLFPWKSQSCCG